MCICYDFLEFFFIAFVALLQCSFLLQTLSTSVSSAAYFEISQQAGKKLLLPCSQVVHNVNK